MTTELKSPEPKAVSPSFRVQVVLAIGATLYRVDPVSCDAGLGRRAFRLAKRDGTEYDVIQTGCGAECDCPDFIFRRAGLDPAGCKHVKALARYGMIDPGVHLDSAVDRTGPRSSTYRGRANAPSRFTGLVKKSGKRMG